jgi:hypothetical protein
MEYHTYPSLYTIIKQQYPALKSSDQDKDSQTYNQLYDFYKNPKLETVISSIKSTIEPAKENKDDRDKYVYFSRNYT